jgi:hypothetical protein
MSFFRDLSTVSARGPLVAAVLAASTLLAACGGGDQKETFQPNRIVTVGDENSLINPDGRQYSVNNIIPVTSTNPNGIACINNPIWVEYVAADYGLPFGECRGAATADTKKYALMLAQQGAKVADVAATLTTVSPALNGNDLVTLMAGAHDLLEMVEANPTPNATERTAMVNAATARGEALGDVVLAIIGTGARVLVSTVHKLGTTPAVAAQGLDGVLLNDMSSAFNNGLNARMATVPSGGGRNGAILEADQLVEAYYRNNDSSYTSIINRTTAACLTGGLPTPDAQLNTCTTTDSTTASPVYYLWAGRIQFGAITQGLLGQQAVQRIRANPL